MQRGTPGSPGAPLSFLPACELYLHTTLMVLEVQAANVELPT
jgi:hypothetical protein